MIRLLTFPVRALYATARTSARYGYRSARLVGFGRAGTFGAGVAVGVLVASPDARQAATGVARRALDAVRDLRRPSDDELLATVAAALNESTTTWHLAQPEISVAEGVVTLRGTAPGAAQRAALGEAAAACSGVTRVDNQVALVRDGDQ